MRKSIFILFVAITLVACKKQESKITKQLSIVEPIQLHPDNQHYFLYKEKPLAIISSAEHYGAVINPQGGNKIKN